MKRLNRCIKMASLEDFIRGLPGGNQTQLGDRGVKSSGGQRQRIAIARALYRQPDILVLDEATSSLDPKTQQTVLQAIGRFGTNLTTLVVSHNMTAVQGCDHIFLLEQGRLVAQGNYQDVMGGHSTFGTSVG